MHPTMLMPEVLTAILQRVDNAHLAQAARVCRAWSEVALDLLYHTIERDQWTHESFTRLALNKNAFRIRELHCGYFDDITPFYQGLVRTAAISSTTTTTTTSAGAISTPVDTIAAMNQLRVFECPSISMNNATMILDILKFSPGIEKLVLPLLEMKTPAPFPFRTTHQGQIEEVQKVFETLLHLLTQELPDLRELTLRDWRMSEGDLERLLASPKLRQSLEVLDLDDTNDGWIRSPMREKQDKLSSSSATRLSRREYRDQWMALPQERVAALSKAEPFVHSADKGSTTTTSHADQARKPWSRLRWLRINGFPEGPLTVLKVTRWCPHVRTLVLAGGSVDANLFQGYRPKLYEELDHDDEEEEEEEDGDAEEDGEEVDFEAGTATIGRKMPMTLAAFRDTLRRHCPEVEELKLEQIGIIQPKPLRYLLQAFSTSSFSPAATTTGQVGSSHLPLLATTGGPSSPFLKSKVRGLRRFETGDQVALPASLLQHLIETVGQTLEAVVLWRSTIFFAQGQLRLAPDTSGGSGSILDLVRSCPSLTHVDIQIRFWAIDAATMLGLAPAAEHDQGEGDDGGMVVQEETSQQGGPSPSELLRWACHDTLETLKCRVHVTVPLEEEMERGTNAGILALPTGRRIYRLVVQFLDSMPRLQCRIGSDPDYLDLY